MCRIVAAGLLSFALLLGCSGGDSPVQPDARTLEGTTLGASSAIAFEKVRIENLPDPDSPEKFEVVLLLPALRADSHAERLLVLADEVGAYFNAPLHPVTPLAGGTVTLQITDGTQLSNEFALELESLPTAPGAFESYVTTLRALVEQRAAWAGTSLAELQTRTFAQVEPLQVPLKIAQMYVDSDEEGSLSGLVENTAGFLSADERELLDRLLGYAPVHTLIQADLDTFMIAAPDAPRPRASVASPVPRVARRACLDLGPPIDTAAQLSSAMLSSALADVAINPGGAPGRTLDALEVVLVGGSALPAFGRAFGAMASGVAAWETAADFTRSVFPSRFTALEFDFDEPEFDEDQTTAGTWSSVKVTAMSDGWDASKEIAKIVYDRLKPDFPLLVQVKLEGARYIEPGAMLGFNSALQSFLEENGGLELCPQSWTIDITGLPWSTAQVLDRKFSVDTSALEVRPVELASDVLRVAAQPSEFGGRAIEQDLPIEVKTIVVSMTPDEIMVEEPGDVATFTAAIEYAEDETLGWTAAQGSFVDGLGSNTPGGAFRSLQTPTAPELYPFIVVAESMSRQGLRSSGTPTRAGTVTIRLAGPPAIAIVPSHACIQPGETQQFEAHVAGQDEYTLRWSILEGYGSIDQNGLYQSLGEGTSSARIGVEIVGQEEVRAEATVDARSCVCFLTGTIIGNAYADIGTSDLAYLVQDFEGLVYQFFVEPGGSGETGVGMSIGGIDERPSPGPGDTGTWRCGFVFFNSAGAWNSVWDDENSITGVSVTIDELTESFMTGRFSGQAVQLSPDGKTVTSSVQVDLEFRAGRWDFGRWPCGE